MFVRIYKTVYEECIVLYLEHNGQSTGKGEGNSIGKIGR